MTTDHTVGCYTDEPADWLYASASAVCRSGSARAAAAEPNELATTADEPKSFRTSARETRALARATPDDAYKKLLKEIARQLDVLADVTEKSIRSVKL